MLEKVVSALTAERDTAAKRVAQIDQALAALQNGAGRRGSRKVRRISAAGIRKIKAAQKARWAKYKRTK
jgi:hypothetical protein